MRTRWGHWPRQRGNVPGYTLLIPVPGDLPVFLRLALAVNRRQAHRHRVATVVIPDQPSARVSEIVGTARSDWPDELSVRYLPYPERWYLPRLASAWRNYGVQVVTGTAAARSTHVIFHDADLFSLGHSMLDEHYEECRDRALGCLGVSPVWDTWFADRGSHLAATWELCAAVEWMRSYPPHLHMAHHAVVLGEDHSCDVTLHPQVLSDPATIAVRAGAADFVHFNYVIGTYRDYQRSPTGFVDEHFRLLLIRVFIDMFDRGQDYGVPSLSDLAEGLTNADAPVQYPAASDAAGTYEGFRLKLGQILREQWSADSPNVPALSAFDDHYGVKEEPPAS